MTNEVRFPSLAAVIAKHRWTRTPAVDVRCTGCDWREDLRGSDRSSVELISEHISQVWREARILRTAADLDELPDGSAIRVRAGLLYVVAEKDDGQWWAPGTEHPVDARSLLHALLIWHPDWVTQ